MTQVTAHDFYDEFHAHNDLPGVFFPDECEKGIEALLFQVRAQAHAEGRREGLKEMDEAWSTKEKCCTMFTEYGDHSLKNSKAWNRSALLVQKFRQEYSNQP